MTCQYNVQGSYSVCTYVWKCGAIDSTTGRLCVYILWQIGVSCPTAFQCDGTMNVKERNLLDMSSVVSE